MLLLGGMFLWTSLVPSQAHTACRNPNIAEEDTPLLRPVAASGPVEIKWFGHAFFQITSSAGTRIITDPFGNMGYPMPEVWPHVVTVGRESGNHNNVGLAKGEPLVLRGQNLGTNEWNQVNTTFRDVLIYNVPIHTRGIPGYFKGSAFVFEMDGLCICHTGDVGEPFNEDQLELIGHVDVVLLPVGGAYTMGPENAKKVTSNSNPRSLSPCITTATSASWKDISMGLIEFDVLKPTGSPSAKTPFLRSRRSTSPKSSGTAICEEIRYSVLCRKRIVGYPLGDFGQNQIPIQRRTHPMSGYLWKATVRNVNRALKEVNAFEWEGDYSRGRDALDMLEERMDEELEQYLG